MKKPTQLERAFIFLYLRISNSGELYANSCWNEDYFLFVLPILELAGNGPVDAIGLFFTTHTVRIPGTTGNTEVSGTGSAHFVNFIDSRCGMISPEVSCE
jgi:hypothetical protein